MRKAATWFVGLGFLTIAMAGLAPASGPAPLPGAPSAAVQALLAQHGLELTPAQAEAARALDALPAPTAAALAQVVRSFAAFEAATARAFAGVDLGFVQAWQEGAVPLPASAEAAWAAAGFDPAPIVAARADLLRAGLALEAALATTHAALPARLDATPVLVIDSAGTSDAYPLNTALIVDFGGDDVYTNNAGGSNLLGVCLIQLGPGAGALLDFGGHDRYVRGDRACGINGGASTGAGFLLDTAGDDVYATDLVDGNKAVNGGGAWLGVGLLMDRAGNDAYTSGGWGTNGGGYIGGLGALVDEGGDDVYMASTDGVNGGGQGGLGLLLDQGGHDQYRESCPWACSLAWDQTIAPKEAVGAQLDL